MAAPGAEVGKVGRNEGENEGARGEPGGARRRVITGSVTRRSHDGKSSEI